MTEKDEESPEKPQLWKFDESLFQPLRLAGTVERRVIQPGRALVKYALYSLPFAYPVVLVSIGVVYGGLAFWASFAGSVGLIWVVLKKSGRARTFANADVGKQKFIGLLGGCALVLAMFYGLLYSPLKIFTIPLMGLVLTLIFLLALKKGFKR